MLDVAAKAARQGVERPLPDKVTTLLDDEPRIGESDRVFLDGFRVLSTCREVGFGIGPIPWWCIDLYAQRHGFDDDPDFMRAFTHIILEIDAGFRGWYVAHPPRPAVQPSGESADDRRRGRRA